MANFCCFFQAIRSVVVKHILLSLLKLSCHQWIMTASPLVQMFLCPQMIEDISTETKLVITVCVNCTLNLSEVLGKVFAKIDLLLLVRTKLAVTKHYVLAKAPTWKFILVLFLNYIHERFEDDFIWKLYYFQFATHLTITEELDKISRRMIQTLTV